MSASDPRILYGTSPTNYPLIYPKLISQPEDHTFDSSLLGMALMDSKSVLQRHAGIFQFPSSYLFGPSTLQSTLEDVLDMTESSSSSYDPDEILESDPLMTAPIVELHDMPALERNESFGFSAAVHVHMHTISPCQTMGHSPASMAADNGPRFREFQAGQWTSMYEELCAFRQKHGHTSVPHRYAKNQSLGRWVKRQRYQFKLWKENQPSTMTPDRAHALAAIGFVWDSQNAAWFERYEELKAYRATYGTCNVPSNSPSFAKLSIWIKCQRRQHKLLQEGQSSNMTPQRIADLERVGLQWELRHAKKRKCVEI